MKPRSVAVGATGVALAAWIGWGLYTNGTTETVPYEVRAREGSVEIRRYPETVGVETTADDDETAFGRLFRYIGGENEADDSVAMTAPVGTEEADGSGESIDMTAPVRTDDADGGRVSMTFTLPSSYTKASAPVPTDPSVRLVVEAPRTVAAVRFSWFATAGRVERLTRTLLAGVAESGLEPVDEPVLLRYDAPRTPPFMRRNEVAVTVDDR